MQTINEWETLRLKADENVELHRKGEAHIRFVTADGKTEA